MNSRHETDTMAREAVATGGMHAAQPPDHGVTNGWSFSDEVEARRVIG